MGKEAPLLVEAGGHRLPLLSQLCFQIPTHHILEHGRACALCRDQHRQLRKGKVFPKILCLGNLSIKWVSSKDFTYAWELLEVCFNVLTCFFSGESQSRLTSLTPREALGAPLERVALA